MRATTNPPSESRRVALAAGIDSLREELWIFFRQWLTRPLTTAAFSPSSRFLSRRMVQAIPPVVRGDACAMDRLPQVAAFARRSPVQAVVSGLGLLSMSREAQYSILSSAFELMPEDGSFVQFAYGPLTPVAGEVMRWLGLRARRHGFTLCNLPPASVYVFSRDRASG